MLTRTLVLSPKDAGLDEYLTKPGLQLNVKKTEYMTCYTRDPATSQVGGSDLPRADFSKYLGSTLLITDNLAHKVVPRVKVAKLKWRSIIGVLCDKKVPELQSECGASRFSIC